MSNSKLCKGLQPIDKEDEYLIRNITFDYSLNNNVSLKGLDVKCWGCNELKVGRGWKRYTHLPGRHHR